VKDQEIIRICGERGLTVVDVRRDGRMLQLVPEGLDALPSPEVLRELADALRTQQTRWVTLVLEGDQ
jgi:hypothetical protein